MIKEVSSFADAEKVIRDSAVSPVVYFTASWCVPCKQMKPQFARAGVLDSDRDYLIVDVDTMDADTLNKYSISSVPTILKFESTFKFTRIEARKAADIVSEVATAE
jgi:thiol-disulfide isomerase/thioredoxin